MTTTPARRGGRATRTAMRAAPLTDDIKPVRPGMPSGRYKALTDSEVLKIHEAAINVLENIGIADAIPSTLEYLLPKGCKLDSNGRLLFPRSLIEHTLEIAARNFPLYAQDPKFDMEPWGDQHLLRYCRRCCVYRRLRHRRVSRVGVARCVRHCTFG